MRATPNPPQKPSTDDPVLQGNYATSLNEWLTQLRADVWEMSNRATIKQELRTVSVPNSKEVQIGSKEMKVKGVVPVTHANLINSITTKEVRAIGSSPSSLGVTIEFEDETIKSADITFLLVGV
jgi:hypothetical protein